MFYLSLLIEKSIISLIYISVMWLMLRKYIRGGGGGGGALTLSLPGSIILAFTSLWLKPKCVLPFKWKLQFTEQYFHIYMLLFLVFVVVLKYFYKKKNLNLNTLGNEWITVQLVLLQPTSFPGSSIFPPRLGWLYLESDREDSPEQSAMACHFQVPILHLELKGIRSL